MFKQQYGDSNPHMGIRLSQGVTKILYWWYRFYA